MVQLFEEVLVPVLSGRLVHLVLHLEHDGDVFHTGLVVVPEYIVAFASTASIIVLLKQCTGKAQSTDLVELRLAVLFQRFTHHLGRKASFHLFVASKLLILESEETITVSSEFGLFSGMLTLHRGDFSLQFSKSFVLLGLSQMDSCIFFGICSLFLVIKLRLQADDLAILIAEFLLFLINSFSNRQIHFGLKAVDPGLQRGNDLIFLGFDQLDRCRSLGLEFFFELFVPDLLGDRRIGHIIHRKYCPAVRTNNVGHKAPPCFVDQRMAVSATH